MNEAEVNTDTTEYEFDFDSAIKAHIQSMHQEGNYLVGVTDTGIKFRQHLKQGKRLNMKGGKYVIENVEVV